MGQKVHPYGFRLGYNRSWHSRWFAKRGFDDLLIEDLKLKKELKKRVRGVRVIERQVEGRTDPEAQAVQGYCDAVRSALTDDGRAPLEASGLQLRDRLEAIDASLQRVAEKRGSPENCND